MDFSVLTITFMSHKFKSVLWKHRLWWLVTFIVVAVAVCYVVCNTFYWNVFKYWVLVRFDGCLVVCGGLTSNYYWNRLLVVLEYIFFGPLCTYINIHMRTLPYVWPLFCKKKKKIEGGRARPQNINFTEEARRLLRFTYDKCLER